MVLVDHHRDAEWADPGEVVVPAPAPPSVAFRVDHSADVRPRSPAFFSGMAPAFLPPRGYTSSCGLFSNSNNQLAGATRAGAASGAWFGLLAAVLVGLRAQAAGAARWPPRLTAGLDVIRGEFGGAAR